MCWYKYCVYIYMNIVIIKELQGIAISFTNSYGVQVLIREHIVQVMSLKVLLIVMTSALILVGVPGKSYPAISGFCSNCHTMHNSQGGDPMTLDDSATPNENLTVGSCVGCHAQGGSTTTVNIGPDIIPQVMHSSESPLAGGNFGYITGLAGSGESDSKGHNIVALTGADSVFTGLQPPPGALNVNGTAIHPQSIFMRSDILGCDGINGCHGYRAIGGSADFFPNGVFGAHHNNAGGKLDNPTTHANSYRFLFGVKGYESSDWQASANVGNHNEYFGRSTPVTLGCSATSCHAPPGGIVKPADGTISQFCATCHGNFHSLDNGYSEGIGTTATSPFKRHPTDLALPTSGEYVAYTVYNLDAPVARTIVPDTPSAVVTPGSDAVMCLTCHLAHASNYPDMLRWDYTTMIAGSAGAAAGKGCFTCHSGKE